MLERTQDRANLPLQCSADGEHRRKRALLAQDVYPIVYLKLLPSPNIPSHAVVVWEVDERQVFLLDPMAGERSLPRSRFFYEWNNTKRTLILVER